MPVNENQATTNPPSPRNGQRLHSREIREIISFLKTLSIFLVIAVVLRASVVEAYKIPSGSMIPTLKIWDHILVCKFSYGFNLPFFSKSVVQLEEPKRGDVVVFTRPPEDLSFGEDPSMNIIKRVIGLPGDVIEVRGTKVFINNQYYAESYARWDEGGIREGYFGPEKVPAGHVLLLGDNRDHSKDSRFWSNPFLPISRIKGRALMIYWSWDDISRIGTVIR